MKDILVLTPWKNPPYLLPAPTLATIPARVRVHTRARVRVMGPPARIPARVRVRDRRAGGPVMGLPARVRA
jgi:hypothetical protein